jgi:dTMP kinase
MFITFEGIDKSGKTTQSQILIKKLEDNGFSVIFLREPGGTKISEKIRNLLLDVENSEMFPSTEYLLYSASRTQLVNEVIIPALKEKKVVVCDRYYDSSTAYQGYGRGIDLQIIKTINNFAAPVIPDLSFFIDIDIEEANRRTAQMDEGKDRLESSGDSFFNKVRKGFLSVAAGEPERFIVLDGRESKNNISEMIWKNVSNKLGIIK